MGQMVCTGSLAHGMTTLLHRKPASAVTFHDSHGAQNMLKYTLRMCLPLTAPQQRSRYIINSMTFNPFHATNETSSIQTTSLLPTDVCFALDSVLYLNMQLKEGNATEIFSC
jgi:hypothetical protein